VQSHPIQLHSSKPLHRKKTLKMMSERAVLLDDENKSLLWLGESNENKTEKKKKGIT
jgi:hypothetical protein